MFNMNNIDKSIVNLIVICEKYGVEVAFAHTDAVYPSELPNNKFINEFYEKNNPVNCTLDMGSSLLKLFRMEELLKKQEGYRWLAGDEKKTLLQTWSFDHVVIADDIGGGKPIIAEIREDTTLIYGSYDGSEPFFIASSLSNLINALSSIVDIINHKYKVYEIYDENEEIVEDFKVDFFKSLESILNEECSKNLFDYLYG